MTQLLNTNTSVSTKWIAIDYMSGLVWALSTQSEFDGRTFGNACDFALAIVSDRQMGKDPADEGWHYVAEETRGPLGDYVIYEVPADYPEGDANSPREYYHALESDCLSKTQVRITQEGDERIMS